MRDELTRIREPLLELHKALLDSERVTYERTFGAIPSPNAFLQLLTTDPWFAWLRPLSDLIVAIDTAIDEDEPLKKSDVDALFARMSRLLVADPAGHGFAKHYDDALQRDPDVVIAHSSVVRLLRDRPK